MREASIDEGDEVVWENMHKDEIRFEDSGKFPRGGDIGVGGHVGGSREEIGCLVQHKLHDEGEVI